MDLWYYVVIKGIIYNNISQENAISESINNMGV